MANENKDFIIPLKVQLDPSTSSIINQFTQQSKSIDASLSKIGSSAEEASNKVDRAMSKIAQSSRRGGFKTGLSVVASNAFGALGMNGSVAGKFGSMLPFGFGLNQMTNTKGVANKLAKMAMLNTINNAVPIGMEVINSQKKHGESDALGTGFSNIARNWGASLARTTGFGVAANSFGGVGLAAAVGGGILAKLTSARAEKIKSLQSDSTMSNVPINDIVKIEYGLNKIGKTSVTVINDMKMLAAQFEEMGYKGKNAKDVLLDFGDKIKNMSAIKAVNIGKAFGLDPETVMALKEGSETIKNAMNSIPDSKLITPEDINSANEYSKALRDLGSSFDDLASAAKPAMTFLMNFTTGAMKNITKLIQDPKKELSRIALQLGSFMPTPVKAALSFGEKVFNKVLPVKDSDKPLVNVFTANELAKKGKGFDKEEKLAVLNSRLTPMSADYTNSISNLRYSKEPESKNVTINNEIKIDIKSQDQYDMAQQLSDKMKQVWAQLVTPGIQGGIGQ